MRPLTTVKNKVSVKNPRPHLNFKIIIQSATEGQQTTIIPIKYYYCWIQQADDIFYPGPIKRGYSFPSEHYMEYDLHIKLNKNDAKQIAGKVV